MLAQLGDLDPGERGEGPAGPDQLRPGGFGVATPPESSQEAGSLAEQATLCPGRISSHRIWGGPGVGQGIAAGPATEVGPVTWRPPGTVVVGLRVIGHGRPGVSNERGSNFRL